MEKYLSPLISLLVTIVFLTILAVIVGKQSSTSSVIKDFTEFYQKAIKTFLSPIKR